MKRAVLTALTLLVVAAPALALDYWPTDPEGLVFRYRDAVDGLEHDAVYDLDGFEQTVTRTWDACVGGEGYVADASAAGMTSWSWICDGMTDPESSEFDSPLVLVREDMADGDEWAWLGGIDGQQCVVMVTVTAETVTVPMGTFETLHVFLNYLDCPVDRYAHFWFHRELGPVKIDDWELVSIGEIVRSEGRTWSTVKSLFD